METRTRGTAIVAAAVIFLCVEPGWAPAGSAPAPVSATSRKPCASYADCPSGMICAGAGAGARGSCSSPSELRQARPAYDPLPEGYLGSIYGHPIIQGQPPAGAPSSDAGGVWTMKDGAYRPPRGGKWTYRPGGANGFDGVWVYTP